MLLGIHDWLLMGLTITALQVPSPPMKLKQRVILLNFIHKVSVKASRRSVGGMAYKPTSKVCDIACDDEYIGETSRTFGERFKKHLKDPSPIHHHSNNTGHPTSQNNFQVIGREGHDLARNIKVSILLGFIIPH